jgi:hypothetical protein
MENSRPQPESSDNKKEDSKEETAKKRKDSRFLDAWQRLSRPDTVQATELADIAASKESEDEDDEEGESNPLKKLWKSLGSVMRKGYTSEVENPPAQKSESIERNDIDNQNAGESNESGLYETDSSLNQAEDEIFASTNTLQDVEPTARDENQVPSSDFTDRFEDRLKKLFSVENPHATSSESDDTTQFEETVGPKNTQDIAGEDVYQSPDAAMRAEVFGSTQPDQGVSADSIHQRVDEQPKTVERVVERGLGGALPTVLVGLEHIGRKRADRKLQKTDKEIKEKQLEQAELAKQSKYEQLRQRTEIERIQQELKDLRERREKELAEEKDRSRLQGMSIIDANRELTKAHGNEVVNELKKEQKLVPQAEQSPITSMERLAEYSEHTQTSPDRVLQKVREASERGEAIEKQYELRQEVRDKDDTSLLSQPAANYSPQNDDNAYQQASSSWLFPADSNSSVAGQHHQGQKYNHAVRNGFIGALVILVFALMAYLFISSLS